MSVADFLDALRALPLLDAAQQAQVASLGEQYADIQTFGEELIRRCWLTPFQVSHIACGRGNDLVLDQYVLVDLLGQGGMGAVYKARQQRMKRLVALKLIRPESLNNPIAVERFQREAEAAAKLSHPNIVTVFDTNEVNGIHFLVMEYLEGGDLAKLVKEKGPLRVGFACDCVRQAALGLQHAHEHGLIHRDIKPHNLMLTKEGVVKVMDLGLVRTAQALVGAADHELTATGAVMGSPDYLAPEQALNAKGVDIRADIYSLGCTFYHLLTGRKPYVGQTLAELLLKHQVQEPEPVEQVRPGLPEGLPRIVRQMMAKRPDHRYPTPADVAKALEEFAQKSDDFSTCPMAGTAALPSTEPVAPMRAPSDVTWETPAASSGQGAEVPNRPNDGVRVRDRRRMGLLLLGVLAVAVLVGAVSIPFLPLPPAKPGPSELAVGPPTDSGIAPMSVPGNRSTPLTPTRSTPTPTVPTIPPTNHAREPREPSKEVIEAWRKAGATYGAWTRNESSGVQFTPRETWAGGLPGFLMPTLPNMKLPDARVPFGLTVHKIDDAGMKELAELKSLQTLDLNSTAVTDAGLKELAGLNSLQMLFLSKTQATDVGLKELARLPSLQALYLNSTQVSDPGLKELARLKDLQTLGLNGTKVSDAGLKELAGSNRLQALYLGNTQISSVGLKELAGLKGLRILYLGNTQVTDAGLKTLTGLTDLEMLDLSNTQTSDVGLKELSGLKALRWLDLNTTQVTDGGLKKLTDLKALQTLYVMKTQVSNAGLKELAVLPALQSLDLRNTQVDDAGLKELAVLKSLHTLSLAGKKFTDAGLKELAGLNSLQTLYLFDTKVSDAGRAELQKALPQCKIYH